MCGEFKTAKIHHMSGNCQLSKDLNIPKYWDSKIDTQGVSVETVDQAGYPRLLEKDKNCSYQFGKSLLEVQIVS